MNTGFILEDLLKDKQLTIIFLGQIICDLKESQNVKALLQSMMKQKLDQCEEILNLIKEYEKAKSL